MSLWLLDIGLDLSDLYPDLTPEEQEVSGSEFRALYLRLLEDIPAADAHHG